MPTDLNRSLSSGAKWLCLGSTLLAVWCVGSLLRAGSPAGASAENVAPAPAQGGTPQPDAGQSPSEPWRVANRCGINSAYVFLKLLGRSVSYEEVEQALPVRKSGQSVTEMKGFLRSKGIPAEAVKVTPEKLRECPLPAIALLEADRDQGGHFVVILEVRPDTLWMVDGTSGAVDYMPSTDFFKQWHGYLLINASRPTWLTGLYAVTMAIGVVTVAYGGWSYVARRHNRRTVERIGER